MSLKASRFLNPKADIVFKRIFGDHDHLLISFLNALMPLPDGVEIKSLEYLTSEQVPVIPDFRRSIVDVKCYDQLGRTFIVEMQMQWVKEFASRLLYGSAQAYVQQLSRGDTYKQLCPVYGLGLINDNFDISEDWYHHYRMSNVKAQEKTIEGIELVLLELPKFKPSTRTEKKITSLWLRFLNEAESLDEIPEDFKSYPELIEAMELSQESGFTRPQLEYYNSYWDAVSRERTLVEGSFEKGEKVGLEKGREEGELIGLEKGREEGVRLIAYNLKLSGQNSEFISKITGLSKAEIEQL